LGDETRMNERGLKQTVRAAAVICFSRVDHVISRFVFRRGLYI
jgi:hypothetical protein